MGFDSHLDGGQKGPLKLQKPTASSSRKPRLLGKSQREPQRG